MGFKPSFNAEKGLIKVLVRLSYFKGFSKTASVEGGALKYRTNGLMYKATPEGKESIAVVKKAIDAIVKKEWPGKDPEKFVPGLKDRAPLFDGDLYTNEDGEVREHYAGTRFLKLTNDKKPKYKRRNGEDCDEEERDELFQSGHWCIAYLHFYTIKDKNKGGNGIFATLDALQYYKKDEAFSGGGIDDDEFDDLGDDEDDDEAPAKPGKSSKRSADIDDDDDI